MAECSSASLRVGWGVRAAGGGGQKPPRSGALAERSGARGAEPAGVWGVVGGAGKWSAALGWQMAECSSTSLRVRVVRGLGPPEAVVRNPAER